VTRLESFLKANGIKPLALATEAGISRQHLHRVRKGIAQPTIRLAALLRDACGRLLHRHINLSDLFEV
jgi:transcriptional regulator with XRE-family HTH domain